MNTLEEWTAHILRELDLDAALVEVDTVLDVARDVAHGVARPAAPLTTYLLGVAVGRGADPSSAARQLARLATEWSKR